MSEEEIKNTIKNLSYETTEDQISKRFNLKTAMKISEEEIQNLIGKFYRLNIDKLYDQLKFLNETMEMSYSDILKMEE